MIKLILFFLAITTTLSLKSQIIAENTQSVRDEIKNATTTNSFKNVTTFDKRKSSLQGSPLLYSSWVRGAILIKGKKEYYNQNILLNFDCTTQELWVKQMNYEFVASNLDIDKFMIYTSNDTLFFEKHPHDNSLNFYLKIFVSEKVKIYEKKYKKIKYSDFVDRGIYTSGEINDKIIEDNKLFLSIGPNLMQESNRKLKYILKCLPQQFHSKAKKFAKNKKFAKFLTDEEIIQLFTYLNF